MVWLINWQPVRVMKKKDKQAIKEYTDSRLIKRLRIYLIITFIMLLVIAFEVIISSFTILTAIIGIAIGFLVGRIISRIYHLSWDEETHNVIGRVDWIGGIILVSYLVFVFTRAHYLGYWIHGTPLFAFILSLTAGTLLGRVMGTRRGIKKILKASKIFDFSASK